jgi:hypothetical protein
VDNLFFIPFDKSTRSLSRFSLAGIAIAKSRMIEIRF